MAGLIDSSKVSGVLSEADFKDDSLFKEITGASAVLSLGRNIGNMPKGKASIPIPQSLISVGWVEGESGKKPVADGSIGKEMLVAGKLAGIVLIPTDVIEDADIDLWESWIRPNAPAAFGAAIDAAALFGVNKPSTWTGFQGGIVPQAKAKGMTVNAGDSLYDSILGVEGMIHKVNANGFSLNGWVGDSTIEAMLRAERDGISGRPMLNSFLNPMTNAASYDIDGKKYYSLENGAWADEDNNSLLIGGDFKQLIYSYRKELEWKMSTDATVTLADGTTVNCFQQNVVAFLMELRVAAGVLNPVTRKNPDGDTRFPFAVLTGGSNPV